MVEMTSAAANKMIKSLNDDKQYLLEIENSAYTYISTVGVEDEVPEYDYDAIQNQIRAIDDKIVALKHAVNYMNVTTKLPDMDITVDQALVIMAQINNRKAKLDEMRKKPEKARKTYSYGDSSNGLVEYVCANYDISKVADDYKRTEEEVMKLQMGIDYINQTVKFEVDI